MNDPQLAIQRLLSEKLGEIKAKNPSYSLRAFAKRSGLSSGALSQILSGKRKVSWKIAERLSETLALDPQERSEVLGQFPERRRHLSPELSRAQDQYLQLSADQYKAIGEWQHFALLSLLNVHDFQNDVGWIARRLGLPTKTASQALERLKRLGLVETTESGSLRRTQGRIRSSDDIASASLRRAHSANLTLAQEKLESVDVENRDYTAITMAIDPSQLPQAKELIRKFQDELASLLESGTKSEVYKLCVQLFPLTNLEGDET